MNSLVGRLQLAMLEQRTTRALIWFFAAGIIIYLASIFWFGWQKTVTAFAALGFKNLLSGIIISSSSYLWRFGRWDYSLRHLHHTIPKKTHLAIYLSGLALTATPGKLGETFRSALLVNYGVKVTNSLAAFFVDRGSDVLGILLLGALTAIMAGQKFSFIWILSFTAILLVSITFAYGLLHPAASTVWRIFGHSIKWRPISGGKAMLESWAKLWSPRRVLAFSFIAMLAYGTQALVFSWFCNVLGTGISFADCTLIFVQATLFGAASMIPGGLGAMEAALVFQLLEFGVSDDQAMSLAISIRLVTLWFGMLLGIISLLFLSAKKPITERK